MNINGSSAYPRNGRISRFAVTALLLAMLCPAAPAQDEDTLKLRTSFFFGKTLDINVKDAEAVVTVFADMIFIRENIRYRSEPLVFKSAQEAIQSYNQGNIDVLTVSPFEYIDQRDQFDGIPTSSDGSANDTDQSLVLLVHHESAIFDVGDLHGRLNILDELDSKIPQIWLDSLLLEASSRTSAELFDAIDFKKDLMKAMIPVFMRKDEACIVTRGGYETMCRLNPQIERSLRVVATSEPFNGMIMFWSPRFPQGEKDRIVRNIHDLDNSVEGSQILEHFRINKIVPFDYERHLAPTERLVQKYRSLIKDRNRKLMSNAQ